MKVLVLLTCHNRINKTRSCINSLINGNKDLSFTFVVVDDGSTDNTVEMLNEMNKVNDLYIVQGNGNLYYSRGMRIAMEFARNLENKYDFVLLVNDDVLFFSKSILLLIERSSELNNAIIAGATVDENGQQTYGGIKYYSKIKYKMLKVNETNIEADTFNANCVLIPINVFLSCEIIDSRYIHSLGDFDYGLNLKKAGYKIYTSKDYVGLCNKNPINNTWQDRSLSIIKRIQKKESIKGAPIKQWFYFLKKHFGIGFALFYSITPFIKIVLRK